MLKWIYYFTISACASMTQIIRWKLHTVILLSMMLSRQIYCLKAFHKSLWTRTCFPVTGPCIWDLSPFYTSLMMWEGRGKLSPTKYERLTMLTTLSSLCFQANGTWKIWFQPLSKENILEVGPFSTPLKWCHQEKAWFWRQPDMPFNFSFILPIYMTCFNLGWVSHIRQCLSLLTTA